MATGSEVQLALAAQEKLAAEHIRARVISFPCWDLFEEQDEEYKESVLPSEIRARVAIEAGIGTGWERYVGLEGRIVSQHGFGASAPYKDLFQHFGFTVENVVEHARQTLMMVYEGEDQEQD
jgi:transketolase